jgi:DNA-binding transcriptional ArsR family regulator
VGDHTQLPLYDEDDIGAYRWTDPDTSEAAAWTVNATRLEGIVRDVIFQRGEKGATCSELVAATGLAWNTVSPRLAPLRQKKFIRDSGMRRMGPSRRMQIVWVSTVYAVIAGDAALPVEATPSSEAIGERR